MRKIGNGWQVNVYEYDTETVYKTPHAGISAFTSIIKDYPAIVLKPRQLWNWVGELQDKQKKSFQYISQRTDLWNDIGQPVLEQSGTYYQKKVTVMREYIKDLSYEEFTAVVDQFVSFTESLHTQKFLINF